MKVRELFETVVEQFANSIDVADYEAIGDNMDELVQIIDTGVTVFGDGVQLEDVSQIGKIVVPIMKLAANFKDWEGEEKKRFVKEAIWLIYKTIDTYPDGKNNNINIPFVFGAIERKLERGIIDFAAGMAVDAVFNKLREDKEV